jgi:voltage-gated potassium channel
MKRPFALPRWLTRSRPPARPRRRHPGRYPGRNTQLPRIRARIYVAAGVLLGMVALGTLGFYAIGEHHTNWSDAFYMTLITLTTVGYGEVVPMVGFWDRLFAGTVALVGFGAVTFLFTSLAVFFLESDLDYSLRRRRMEKQIRKLSGHFIICGFGRVGRNVAHELSATHRPYVAIDVDEAKMEAFLERVPDLLYLHGDASDDDVLLAADIGDAAGVFAVTDDDSRNLMISLTAKQLNPKLRVVARCHEVRNTPKLRKAGADVVVSPDFTGGMRIASSMIRPNVVSFLDEMLRSRGTYRLEEVRVPPGTPVAELASLQITGREVVLLGVRTEHDLVFNPPPDFPIRQGYILVTMCSPQGREALERRFIPV